MPTGLLKNKLAKTLLLSLFISILAIMLFFSGFLSAWEYKVSDSFYYPSETDKNIVIVEIDDKSLDELGLWPWPRDYVANVIEYLNQSKVIAVDITFDLTTNTENDTKLANSLKTGNVVLAMEYTELVFEDDTLYGKKLIKPNPNLGTQGVDFKTGSVNVYTDPDGITRAFPPHISGVEDFDHFAVVVANEYKNKKINLKESRMLINYFSEPGGYNHKSFIDVYNSSKNGFGVNFIPRGYFKDKIVLIGATSADLHDDVVTPMSTKAMPGVEVHANIIQSIINEDFLYHQDDISAICIIILFAFLTGLLLYRFKIHIATILLVVIFIVYFFISIYIFDNFGIIMKILYPLFSLTLTYIPLVVLYYVTEERSKKWITSVFGKYVSPVVIENLIKNPDMINLGGEKRNITIFFSDIRGFTTISEKLEPEELVHLLNDYLTEMTSIIIKDQGLVDKYMGDAIMAFWGAPLDQSNHAEMACLSSLEMIDRLKELKNKWKKEGIPLLDIGIGINSGDAIVGNMGSSTRFDYTAMGDNVNLASRMEGLNKIYGTNIIITEKTQKIIKDKFETRKLDAVRVKGKIKPIMIYELLSHKDKLSKKQSEFIKLYEEGLDLYFQKKWKQAINFFQSASKIIKDEASNIFIKRCKEFQKNSPSSDWDGVWEMKTK